jgi:hypothetical protein
MNTRPCLLALLLTVSGSASLFIDRAHAQDADHGKISILSRAAKIFSENEQALDDALRNHDEAELAKLLAADFELRRAENPGEPVPRADWLKLAAPDPQSHRGQMTVHDHGEIAIASFRRVQPSAGAEQPESQAYVVDVWKKQGQGWQLLTRYESKLAPADAAEPNDVAPDGKG